MSSFVFCVRPDPMHVTAAPRETSDGTGPALHRWKTPKSQSSRAVSVSGRKWRMLLMFGSIVSRTGVNVDYRACTSQRPIAMTRLHFGSIGAWECQLLCWCFFCHCLVINREMICHYGKTLLQRFSLAYRLRYVYVDFRILQQYNSLESAQYGGVSLTKKSHDAFWCTSPIWFINYSQGLTFISINTTDCCTVNVLPVVDEQWDLAICLKLRPRRTNGRKRSAGPSSSARHWSAPSPWRRPPTKSPRAGANTASEDHWVRTWTRSRHYYNNRS